MNPNTFPTKGNLILAKNSLALAKQGFDLMDKKRNILMREIMNLIEPGLGDPDRDRLHVPGGLRPPAAGQHRDGYP